MRQKMFFEKFDRFADVPDAAEKMRELILRLAMSAKLVKQIPNEGDGTQVYRAIQQVRAKQQRTKEIPCSSVRDWVAAGDDFELPDSWHRCAVGDVCDLKTGATPSTMEPRYFGGNIRWLVSGDINKGEIFECEGRITELGMANSNCRLIPKNSVLIALNGQGKTRATVALLRIEAALNQSLVAMIPDSREHLIPEFLFWNLRSRYRAIRDITGHEQRRGLNMKLVGMLSLPLPPVEEQRRIVARVSELMALCDRLEAQQREREERHGALSRAAVARFDEAPTPANLSLLFHGTYSIAPTDLRKSILSLAVHGRLVPQEPGDEPAERLLQIIQRQRAKSSLKSRRDFHIVPADQAPYPIPDKWIWTTLGNLTEVGTGSTPSRTEPSYWLNGSIPWIKSGLTSESQIHEATELVTPAAIKAHRLRIYPSGTLIIALYGQGKTRGQVAVLGIPATVNQACAAICSIEGAPSLQGYLRLLLEKQYEEMRSMSAGGAQPNLNVQKVKKLLVPLPPIAEQARIISRVEQLMRLVDDLEVQIALSLERARDLLDAVVQELLQPHSGCAVAPAADRNGGIARAAIGCYAIERLVKNPNFGRTMLMKTCYLAETHLGLPLGWKPMRQAAGPYDPEIETFESLGERDDWFSVTEKPLSNGHSKIEYHARAGLKAKAAEAILVLGNQRAEFDRLLNLFADKSTEEAEIVATLFAAWNDLLIDGRPASDDDIIREVRENWHPKKERFTPSRLEHWLNWMRNHKLIPKGNGPRTLQQLQLSLV